MENWLIDSANIQKWYSFQLHTTPITLWWVISIFMLLYFQKEFKFWLSHYGEYWFWFLNPFKYLSVQFSSCLLAGKTCIHVSCYLLILGLILKSNVPVFCRNSRGRSRTAATSKMERLLIIVNGFQLLTIITKRSILDVVAVLDPLLNSVFWFLSS